MDVVKQGGNQIRTLVSWGHNAQFDRRVGEQTLCSAHAPYQYRLYSIGAGEIVKVAAGSLLYVLKAGDGSAIEVADSAFGVDDCCIVSGPVPAAILAVVSAMPQPISKTTGALRPKVAA